MKKNIFLFFTSCLALSVFIFDKDPFQNMLEQTVNYFEAKGGQIFIINIQTHQIKRKYKIGESAFSPLAFGKKSDCFRQTLLVNSKQIDTYSCNHIKKNTNQVETISFANLSSIGKNYEVWVVLNEPKPKKETFGFVTAPWTTLPLLRKIILSW